MLRVFYISLLCFCFVLCSNQTCKKLIPTGNLSSCSYQLWTNETEDACQITRLGFNSCECLSELTETPNRNIPQRGFIKIEPYKDISGSRTNFNITAYNITWNNLKIRFQQQKTENCMKRVFTIKKNVADDKILFYDIPWATASIEDKIIEFEYAYGLSDKYDGKRSFLIHVPKSEELKYFTAPTLKNLTLFTYVETTNLYQLVCKIHAAPQHLNVTLYEIEVYFKKNQNVSRIDGPFFKNAENAVFGVIDFEYDTYEIPGEYIFYVKPWNCYECRYSVSPVVIIPETSTILTIGLVGVSCLIPVFLITLYLYFKVDSSSIPRVLLITTPANNAHKKIGRSLAKLLIEKFNIPTMIDILDIPIPNIMPSDWFTNSFKSATHIIILLSDDKPITSIYRNTDNLLYSLMQGDPEKICCTIEFPFTKKTDLKFNVHKNFKLMRDYNAFVNFIQNRGYVRGLIRKVMKNDLYYDLVEQIDDYGKGGSCVSDGEETIPTKDDLSDFDDDYYAHNKINVRVDTDEEDKQDVADIVRICLDNIERSSGESDDSEDSDVEPLADVQILLRKKMFGDEDT